MFTPPPTTLIIVTRNQLGTVVQCQQIQKQTPYPHSARKAKKERGLLGLGGPFEMQNLMPSVANFGTFSILDHLDRLNIVKETSTDYHCNCPLCDAGGFKIDKTTGKYNTFVCGCMDTDEGKKAIIQAIAPLEPKDRNYQSPRRQVKPKGKALSLPPIEGPVTLAKFEVIPTDSPQPVKPSFIPNGIPENATQTTYRYSSTQFIKRFDWGDPSKPKERDKTFRQCHNDSEGNLIWNKGTEAWPLYRENEVITAKDWPLLHEGEKCVETTRYTLGLVSTTLQGSNWSEEAIASALIRLKEAGLPGLVFVTDNDNAGKTKGKKVLTASAKTGLPVIVIPITQLWEDAPEAGDLADWIKWGIANGMNTEDFIKRLEIEIHNAVARRSQSLVDPQQQKYNELVNELKLIQQETNPTYREFLISELAEKTRKKEAYLKKILQTLEDSTITPQKNCYTLKELLNLQATGEDWLIPGYIPKGELIINSAAPKVGKTLLATDITRAILTGGIIFGETIKRGKVLFVTSDETIKTVSRRLKASGFDVIPDEYMDNFEVKTHFDINNLADLQAKLHEFKPDLVVFDSLTSIARKSGLSEKDPEFALPIYRLRDLLASVNAAGILIHHDNKSKEAKGIEKMSGSLRIAAAAWGIWQLEKEADNPNTRKLTITPRETEPSAHRLEINPKPLWGEKGIYAYLEEIGDESGEKRTEGQRTLNLLKKGDRLDALEINHIIKSKNIYAVLSRLEDRNLVSTAKSKTTGKTVYFLFCTSDSNELHPPKNAVNPPPPISYTDLSVSETQTITQQEIEPYDHSTNILLTVSLTDATNTPTFQGGGEAEPDVIPSSVSTFEAVEMVPIVEVEKPNNLESENYQIVESENVDEPQQSLEPTKTAESFRFELGDHLIDPDRPDLSLELLSIDPDGEWCRCKDKFGIERYVLSRLIPDEF